MAWACRWTAWPSQSSHRAVAASTLGQGKEAKDRDLPQRNLQTQKGLKATCQFNDRLSFSPLL